MRRLIRIAMVACALGLTASGARALERLVASVAEGCKQEITTYCKDVTPGENRVLACLYAHEDKLSGRCDFALYDAAVQLERAVEALAYVESECHADLEKHCSAIKPGEGRLAACLKRNKVSERCDQAMKDVRLEVEQ